MTLDEAIAYERGVAEERKVLAKKFEAVDNINMCLEYAEEHEQLAEWLEELKAYRASVFSGDMTQSMLKDERNKAIDDFVDRLSEYLNVKNATKYGNKNAEQQRNSYDTLMKYEIADGIDDVAEQLKAGGRE